MSTRTRTRILALAFVLVALLVIYFVRQSVDSFPRQPRLIFENKGTSDIAHLIVATASNKVDVGRVRSGGTVILPIKPRRGERYVIEGNEFSGDELIFSLEMARRDREDVRLGVDEHGCGWLGDEPLLHGESFNLHPEPIKRKIGGVVIPLETVD